MRHLFKRRWPGIFIWFAVGMTVGVGATLLAVFYVVLRPGPRPVPKQLVARGEGYSIIVSQNTAKIQNPPIIWESRTKEKVVALTFDDGPDPNYTAPILDILEEQQVKATFFLVGRDAERYPDLVRREAAEGHELGNHSFSHPELELETDRQIADEINQCGDVIERIGGKRPTYFRPPKGLVSGQVFTIADREQYRVILWGMGVEHSPSLTPRDEATRVIEHLEPGMIILAHDGRLNRSKTVEALPGLIEGAKAKGYRFVTLTELLRLDKPSGRAVTLTKPRVVVENGSKR